MAALITPIVPSKTVRGSLINIIPEVRFREHYESIYPAPDELTGNHRSWISESKIATICRQLQDLGEDPNHPLTTQLIYTKLPTRVVSELVTEGSLSQSPRSCSTELLQSKLIDIVERSEAVYRQFTVDASIYVVISRKK
ncbi:hypothetical protein QR680_004374 [Steinernema hermaphroditum]|uniref:Uncharacterized protein n=1 Tax=Steinernema hermaphroditum TaxID=289476 RepID=A0AA39LTK4_9BILA|nr:hypothetical protein QR680_004374 [Steinernema hermaphroditum]